MRLLLLPMIIIIIINLLVDLYIYKSIRKTVKNKFAAISHTCFSIFLILFIIIVLVLPKRNGDNDGLVLIMWMLFTYLSIYLSKYIYVIFDALGGLPSLFKKNRIKHSRIIAVILSGAVFCVLWIGALHTARTIEVRKVTIENDHLPKGFDNFKIVQFSDFHLGTYGSDTTFVSEVVKQIMDLKPDMIIFSGDLVNRQTTELYPFTGVLRQLHAPYGVYSVLGNHDYGDYKDWPSISAKKHNNDEFKQLQAKMGWVMLNNSSKIIYNHGDSIAVIGVENWGDPPFPKYGNLNKAYKNSNDSVYKVLISHNPCHWDAEVVPKTNIDLMLAGHTHAMQVELDILGERYSPAILRYKEWGGLYTKGKQNLYVNIGLGEVALPMRIGAVPEITLITLKRK